MEHSLHLERPSEAKKILIGFVYKFSLELVFFLVAALCVSALWYGFQSAFSLPTRQHAYLYHPEEVKYLVICVGGWKRRVKVKRFLQGK